MSKNQLITNLHGQALDEISEVLIRLQDETLEVGEIPRRFEEWTEEDGAVLWWETSLAEGKITEPPQVIGTIHDLDDTSEPQWLLWVPLPKLARDRP